MFGQWRPTSARCFPAESSSVASGTGAFPFPACRSTRSAPRCATTPAASSTRAGSRFPGLYCAGWIKRGPTGIIGTNKKDATETVERLLEDARTGLLPRVEATAGDVDAFLAERGVNVVTYHGWEAIDALESSRGEPHGRPRSKLVSWDELLATALQRVS